MQIKKWISYKQIIHITIPNLFFTICYQFDKMLGMNKTIIYLFAISGAILIALNTNLLVSIGVMLLITSTRLIDRDIN